MPALLTSPIAPFTFHDEERNAGGDLVVVTTADLDRPTAAWWLYVRQHVHCWLTDATGAMVAENLPDTAAQRLTDLNEMDRLDIADRDAEARMHC